MEREGSVAKIAGTSVSPVICAFCACTCAQTVQQSPLWVKAQKYYRSRLDILPTRGFRKRAREKIGLVLPK
jgi:hypothetical protein